MLEPIAKVTAKGPTSFQKCLNKQLGVETTLGSEVAVVGGAYKLLFVQSRVDDERYTRSELGK